MTQEKRTSISSILVAIGMLIMVVMIILPLLPSIVENPRWMEWMRWIFTAGAFTVLIARFIGFNRDASLRIKHLHGILIFSALLYCASAAMMFIFQGTNNWIAFLLAGLLVQTYASWMIEREEKKDSNQS